MCGRITLVNLTWPELMDWLTLSAVPDEPIPQSFNRPPTETIPIVRQGGSDRGSLGQARQGHPRQN